MPHCVNQIWIYVIKPNHLCEEIIAVLSSGHVAKWMHEVETSSRETATIGKKIYIYIINMCRGTGMLFDARDEVNGWQIRSGLAREAAQRVNIRFTLYTCWFTFYRLLLGVMLCFLNQKVFQGQIC